MSVKIPDGGRVSVTQDYDANLTALYTLQVVDGDDQVIFECGTDPIVTQHTLTPLEDGFETLYRAIREYLPTPSTARKKDTLESLAKF